MILHWQGLKLKKNREVFYIGQVQDIIVVDDKTEYKMSFMWHASQKSLAFKFPHVDDISDVGLKDIVAKLPDTQENDILFFL